MSTTWVGLLRGVNVGGVTVRSADLRELFDELGFDDVRTVLASGNVVFTASDGVSQRVTLESRLATALSQRFDYDAHILLATMAEIRAAIEAFPYDTADAARQPWVIFCRDVTTRDALITAAADLDADADPVAAGDRVVYWNPPKGSSTDTPFAKILAKPTYRTTTTNRNVRTLLKILG